MYLKMQTEEMKGRNLLPRIMFWLYDKNKTTRMCLLNGLTMTVTVAVNRQAK